VWGTLTECGGVVGSRSEICNHHGARAEVDDDSREDRLCGMGRGS
jgi:hypothetical protein